MEWTELLFPFNWSETSQTLPAWEATYCLLKYLVSLGIRFAKHIAMLYSDPILIVYICLCAYSDVQLQIGQNEMFAERTPPNQFKTIHL